MAALLQLSFGAVRDYEAGKSVPGGKALQAYASLGFDATWLLTGEGEMRKGEGGQAEGKAAPAAPADPHHRREDELAYVPYYNEVEASGGPGAIPANEHTPEFLAFRRRWIKQELGAKIEDLAVIRMVGDSMEPTLKTGDVLLLDAHAALHQGDGIYVIRRRERLQVKRLQFLADKILIRSDNPHWEPEEVDEDSPDFVLAGRVVWVGRKL